jgi:hypothetical protein
MNCTCILSFAPATTSIVIILRYRTQAFECVFDILSDILSGPAAHSVSVDNLSGPKG